MSRPERMCVGCRRRFDQGALLRVGRRSDGELRLIRGVPSGRSAYVCASQDCLANASRKGAWPRAFRARVRWDALQEELRGHMVPTMEPSNPGVVNAGGGK